MIEAYRIGNPEDSQNNPKRLKKFNLEGVPTVAVTPYETLEVIIGNDNPDGTTSVVSIYLDNNHKETTLLEYEMIKKLQFSNREDSTESRTHHLYDKACRHCASGEGHIIRVDDIALGEPNFQRLRLVPWNSFLNKISDGNNETLSRFEE